MKNRKGNFLLVVVFVLLATVSGKSQLAYRGSFLIIKSVNSGVSIILSSSVCIMNAISLLICRFEGILSQQSEKDADFCRSIFLHSVNWFDSIEPIKIWRIGLTANGPGKVLYK